MKSFFVIVFAFFISITYIVNDVKAKLIESDLIFDKPVKKLPNIVFVDEVENKYAIKDFEGQIIILYFWASWCVDCVSELQSLDALKSKLIYENILDVEIIPISIDFKSIDFIYGIYKEMDIKNLGLFLDQNKKIMKAIGVRGVPCTIVLDKDLMQIMKVSKNIKWDSANIIEQIIKLRGGPVKKYQNDDADSNLVPALQKNSDNAEHYDISQHDKKEERIDE